MNPIDLLMGSFDPEELAQRAANQAAQREALAVAVQHDLDRILAQTTLEGTIGPVYGMEERIPDDPSTYQRAVERARITCQHQAAVRLDIDRWQCPQCRRELGLNDVGLGGI